VEDGPLDLVTVGEPDVTVDASEPSAEPEPDGEPGRTGRGPGIRLVAAVVAAAVLLGALGTAVWKVRQLQGDQSAQSSALATARTDAAELATYDYRHLDHDFGLVEAASTPTFRADFLQSSQALSKVLVQYQGKAQGTVVAAGVTSSSPRRAIVLVFVDQTVSNTQDTSGPVSEATRMQISLVHTGSRWLIDHVSLL
jgi:Mce-associated membrane protein